MKKTILLTVFFAVAAMMAQATVWTVNNIHGAADFTTLQAAIDGASGGDTLYIEGSPNAYGNGTFDKPLTVIGPGYWLDENDSTQAYKVLATVNRLTFNPGSEGSIITGVNIYVAYSYSSGSGLIINTDGLIIRKSLIKVYSNWSGAQCKCITLTGSRSNIIIEKNWIELIGSLSANSYCISITGIPDQVVIKNNFIVGKQNGSVFAVHMDVSDPQNDLRLLNNVMWGQVTTYYSEHTNNILITGGYNPGLGDICFNNLCNGTQYPASNNNQQNVDMSTVFADYTKFIDNGYLLAPGSPAIGAGLNGGDCGAFDNSYGSPYVLSGLPAIPAIFDATITTLGTTTLPGNIKAKSHD